jgi:hypothetical protein
MIIAVVLPTVPLALFSNFFAVQHPPIIKWLASVMIWIAKNWSNGFWTRSHCFSRQHKAKSENDHQNTANDWFPIYYKHETIQHSTMIHYSQFHEWTRFWSDIMFIDCSSDSFKLVYSLNKMLLQSN